MCGVCACRAGPRPSLLRLTLQPPLVSLHLTMHPSCLLCFRSGLRQRDQVCAARLSAPSDTAAPMLCVLLPSAVACGNEIKSVVNAVERFSRWPMGKIDQTHMWQVRAD